MSRCLSLCCRNVAFLLGQFWFSAVMVSEPSKAAGWNRWNVALLSICC